MDTIINWLLDGDTSIAFQTKRDLLNLNTVELAHLQNKIETEGFGKGFLDKRNENGHWGNGFYSPKWICTHYSLLELKGIGISPLNAKCQESSRLILECRTGIDGGIDYGKKPGYSDVCINGMILSLLCYFQIIDERINKLIDYLLEHQMPDGGWNCRYCLGATHSSLHTTISVLEGFDEYLRGKYEYRKSEVIRAAANGIEFTLIHKLFRSHRTGEVIDPKMLMLSYPSRWRYDILRALDLFRSTETKYDSRMDDAIDVLLTKQMKDGKWPLQNRHAGEVHFNMEQVGKGSRWNTLRAIRVLQYYGIDCKFS